MDTQKQYGSLIEAYNAIYENQEQLDEGYGLDPKFGSMRKRGGRSAPPEERSVGGERNRSNKDYWADTLGKNRDRGKGSKAKRRAAELGEGIDLFDVILEHLVAEGYADTNEAALAIMANMSEEWKQSIVEQTARIDYVQDKFNRENAAKSGSGLTAIPGKQNTGQALQKAKESARQMGKLQGV